MAVMLDPANSNPDKVKFIDRAHASVVTENLGSTITPTGWGDLMLHKAKFTFIDADGRESFDGVIMMKVSLEEVDPTSSVNIELNRQSIVGAKLQDFNNNFVEILKFIKKHYQAIVEN